MDDETTAITVEVDQVQIPAMSTLGYGTGTDVDSGNRVRFAGDHRSMRALGQAINGGELPMGELPRVELEGWEILQVWRS